MKVGLAMVTKDPIEYDTQWGCTMLMPGSEYPPQWRLSKNQLLSSRWESRLLGPKSSQLIRHGLTQIQPIDSHMTKNQNTDFSLSPEIYRNFWKSTEHPLIVRIVRRSYQIKPNFIRCPGTLHLPYPSSHIWNCTFMKLTRPINIETMFVIADFVSRSHQWKPDAAESIQNSIGTSQGHLAIDNGQLNCLGRGFRAETTINQWFCRFMIYNPIFIRQKPPDLGRLVQRSRARCLRQPTWLQLQLDP